MDLLKSLTGKVPAEYEKAAGILVNGPDCELYKKLTEQEDFLYDFVKANVSQRIKNAVNKDNYKNLLKFFDYYSPSYDTVIAEALYEYSNNGLENEIKNILKNGSDTQKAYAVKYLSFVQNDNIQDVLSVIREFANSEFEPLAANSIEVLSKNNDDISKDEALEKLLSDDEFQQYSAVKFLVSYGAKDALPKIYKVMKKSSLSENIACEIPYLVDLETLLEENFDSAILVLCNIINAIPEIAPISSISDYNLAEILENLYHNSLTSTSALLLRMAAEKFKDITENDEYLYDCDKNTKEYILNINRFLKTINIKKLNSLLYEELYEESDFVFFAVDYIDDIEELETLLDSTNQTLLLKVLTVLKEKNILNKNHKKIALQNITNPNIKQIAEVL